MGLGLELELGLGFRVRVRGRLGPSGPLCARSGSPRENRFSQGEPEGRYACTQKIEPAIFPKYCSPLLTNHTAPAWVRHQAA